MEAVLLVIHLLACLALIGAVMLQRSEGGALGMGGGGTGGFISGRGVANVLVRTTMVLGAGFFVTSLILARIHSEESRQGTTLERTIEERSDDAFDPLNAPSPGTAPAPSTAPVAPAPVDPLAPVLTQPVPGAPAPAATQTAPAATAPAATTPALGTPPPAPATTQTPAPAPTAPQ